MTEPTLTKTRLHAGKWEGVLSIPEGTEPPKIEVLLQNQPVTGVQLLQTDAAGAWVLIVPIPPEAISDGVQIFLIRDSETDRVLNTFAILAGDVLGDTLHSEVELLRAELDMLKRAFRRHCVETMG